MIKKRTERKHKPFDVSRMRYAIIPVFKSFYSKNSANTFENGTHGAVNSTDHCQTMFTGEKKVYN